MQKNISNGKLIELIADSLANFQDWDVPDLKNEFLKVVLQNGFGMNTKLAEFIFDEFMKIDTQKRFGMEFNHLKFVTQLFVLEEKNKDSK